MAALSALLIRPQATTANLSMLASQPPHCGPMEDRLSWKGQLKDTEERGDIVLDLEAPAQTHTCARKRVCFLFQGSGPQHEGCAFTA